MTTITLDRTTTPAYGTAESIWAKGSIVLYQGNYYKVGNSKGSAGKVTYSVKEVTADEYARRTVRVRLPDTMTLDDVRAQVGNVLDHAAGKMLVKEITRGTHHAAGFTSHMYYAQGPLVPEADKAAKAKAKWDRAEAARVAEQAARTAESIRHGGAS